MGVFAASLLATNLAIEQPAVAGEILPEKKTRKFFSKATQEASDAVADVTDALPNPNDPLAPIGKKLKPNIPNFKGSYNAEPIPGRNWPPPPKPRKEPDMDMDKGAPPISYTLNSQLGYRIPIPSDEKWMIEYKPPEPKYKFKIPFITPKYDPNIYWDFRDQYPEKYRMEPTYPLIFSLPLTLLVIGATYFAASKIDPGWNEFFRKTVVKDLYEEGLGTEDVLKAEIPIIMPGE